jgi:hypothetical protein
MKDKAPYTPVKYVAADASAIQQLERGEASPEMQKRALKWIVNNVAETYGQSYRQNTHDTAFAEGKRFVGNTIVKMLKLEPSKLRSKE